MKKMLLTACIGLCGLCSLTAQQEMKAVRTEPQLSDVCNVLATLNIHVFRFDLQAFLQNVYTVALYIDEYEYGQSPRRIRTIRLGKNIRDLNEVPADKREAFRRLKQIPEDRTTWEDIREIALYLTKPNDSTVVFTVDVPDVMQARHIAPLRPVAGTRRIFYQVRPFSFAATEASERPVVPLLLYGSGWMDEAHNVIRFCGEKEIDPALQAQIVSKLPHYYVVGLEFEQVKE